jgi:hypothetical protein
VTWSDAIVVALRNVRRRFGRAVLTVAAVVLAAALLSALLIAVGSARSRVLSAASKGGPLTGVEVFPNAPGEGQLDTDSAKLGSEKTIDDATVSTIKARPDVDSVAAVSSTPVVVVPPGAASTSGAVEPFRDTLSGTNTRDPSRLPITVRAGRLPGSHTRHEVAVTDAYLRLVGVREERPGRVIGTEIEVGAPRVATDARGNGTLQMRWTRSLVVGVVTAQGVPGHVVGSHAQVAAARRWSATSKIPDDDAQLAALAREVTGRSTYDLLFVVAHGLDAVGPVRAGITRLGYSSSAPESIITSVDRYTNVVEIVLTAIGLIALGIAALGIANAMTAAVRERRADIGVLKAIGARDRDVRRIFLVEASILGAAGGLFGTALGYVIARFVGLAVNRYLSSQGLAGVHVGLPLPVVAVGVLGSTVLALVAAAAPAQRAARIPARRAMAGA